MKRGGIEKRSLAWRSDGKGMQSVDPKRDGIEMQSFAGRSGGNVSRAQKRAAEAMMCIGLICAGTAERRYAAAES